MHITISELENDLDGYLDKAESEPVIIEKSGRDTFVLLAYADYERLQALEDAYWGEKALKALARGEFVDGMAVLDKLAKEKGIEIDAPA